MTGLLPQSHPGKSSTLMSPLAPPAACFDHTSLIDRRREGPGETLALRIFLDLIGVAVESWLRRDKPDGDPTNYRHTSLAGVGTTNNTDDTKEYGIGSVGVYFVAGDSRDWQSPLAGQSGRGVG